MGDRQALFKAAKAQRASSSAPVSMHLKEDMPSVVMDNLHSGTGLRIGQFEDLMGAMSNLCGFAWLL